MSYLRFDKTLMINLEESLPREILRTNKSGAYHCNNSRLQHKKISWITSDSCSRVRRRKSCFTLFFR